jgi:hypothetical protein
MTYILAKERDSDASAAFERYAEYLHAHKTQFPPSAYALTTSDWYFNFQDRRCPHDSWLEAISVCEPSEGKRNEIRASKITVLLLGAFQDGQIEFVYSDVQSYSLSMENLRQGHGDWRYDEFRLSESGKVIHEIEWASFGANGRWLIEASDVIHRWIPKAVAD